MTPQQTSGVRIRNVFGVSRPLLFKITPTTTTVAAHALLLIYLNKIQCYLYARKIQNFGK
jgi:hypothetical protein